MKIRNVSKLPVQVFDEHSGRGALVEPGGEVDVSEQCARELVELKETWAAVESTPVRSSGRKKRED
jgi:hypothetical protein